MTKRKNLFIILTSLFFLFHLSPLMGVITHYGPSGEYLGQSRETNSSPIFVEPQGFLKGFSETFPQSFNSASDAILQALQQKQKQQIQFYRLYAKVSSVLNDYNKDSHDDYMSLLADSPDLSYSLKVGLISTYNEYRKVRDEIDRTYNKQYFNLIRAISKKDNINLNKLAKLSLYMDPHQKQGELQNQKKKLPLSKNSLKSLNKFIKEYYKEREKIDLSLREKEQALIQLIGK